MNKENLHQEHQQLEKISKVGRIVGFPLSAFYSQENFTQGYIGTGLLTVSIPKLAAIGYIGLNHPQIIENPLYLTFATLAATATIASGTSLSLIARRFYKKHYQGFFDLKPPNP